MLGRPLAIADDEIDLRFPEETEDDGYHSPEPVSRRGETSTPGMELSFHIQLIQLDQLNTKSRLTLCRLAKAGPGARIEQKTAKRFRELENWKMNIFGSASPDSSKEPNDLMWSTPRTPIQTPASRSPMSETQRLALLLNYHRARRMLLQTMLTDISWPNQPFPFASFAKSSGEVCQLNRRLHRLKSVPFTLLDLHSVFVAGFSMVYCAWTDPELYDAEMAADFGACSTVLYVIAEQWAGAKKYRDAFELVSEKTAEYVQSTSRTREKGQQQAPIASAQAQDGGPTHARASENVLADAMHHSTFDMERSWSENGANDGFDVLQMMNQFVQTQDTSLECDPMNFNFIEELLAEEGLGWFNGNTSLGP